KSPWSTRATRRVTATTGAGPPTRGCFSCMPGRACSSSSSPSWCWCWCAGAVTGGADLRLRPSGEHVDERARRPGEHEDDDERCPQGESEGGDRQADQPPVDHELAPAGRG